MEKIDFKIIFESLPSLYLILDTSLSIVAVNDAYLEATMTKREDILYRNIFEVFPDDPTDPKADGTTKLKASFNRVMYALKEDKMEDQRYAIPIPGAGKFEERWWSPKNFPVLKDGKLTYIIHKVEDITDYIKGKQKQDRPSMEKLKDLTDKLISGEEGI